MPVNPVEGLHHAQTCLCVQGSAEFAARVGPHRSPLALIYLQMPSSLGYLSSYPSSPRWYGILRLAVSVSYASTRRLAPEFHGLGPVLWNVEPDAELNLSLALPAQKQSFTCIPELLVFKISRQARFRAAGQLTLQALPSQ